MKMLYLFLRLIRWPNLLFIFLTQALFYYCVMLPILYAFKISATSGHGDFWLIAFVYQCVAAAGYIINDYFDVDIDVINKPDKVFITRGISKKAALTVYAGLNGIAVLIGVWMLQSRGNPIPLAFILPVTILLLLYSAFFKKRFLIGNVVVACVTASAVPVLLFAKQGLFSGTAGYGVLWKVTGLYGAFALLITFAREVVKDLEDVPGDSKQGGRTMAIVLQDGTVRGIVMATLFCTMTLLTVTIVHLWGGGSWTKIMLMYMVLLVAAPLMWIMWRVAMARECDDYKRLSSNIKIVTLLGILSMLLVQYI